MPWLLSVSCEVSVVFAVFVRRIYRGYPLLSAYCFYQLVRWLYVFSAGSWNSDYSWMGLIDAVLGLAVVYEVFEQTFCGYAGLRKLGSAIFVWAVSVLAVLFVLIAAGASGSDQARILTGLHALQSAASVMQGGLLYFLAAILGPIWLVWRRYAFRCMVGCGVVTSLMMAGTSITFNGTLQINKVYLLVQIASYTLAVLVWAWWLGAPGWTGVARQSPEAGSLAGLNRALMKVMDR